MILMIDNYDSFTYNLVQYFNELGQTVRVFRNDRIELAEIERLRPDYLVISPGPCTPKEAGISVAAVRKFSGIIPLLGVCLGHQAIGFAAGARIVRAKNLMHGKVSRVRHDGRDIFSGVDNPFTAIRYHSLVIDEKTLPAPFLVTGRSDDGEIMAIRHAALPVWGVQFHPESILTTEGKKILANFLRRGKADDQRSHSKTRPSR
ncbi:MAG: aminodeoxychorismate/anthranilate synthase component II [Candidatus Omnitrophica bacterium]|nr:aminodeoxychorismate/anthranilate synthase component II [Candidatus Omnitrophota bacterium]